MKPNYLSSCDCEQCKRNNKFMLLVEEHKTATIERQAEIQEIIKREKLGETRY